MSALERTTENTAPRTRAALVVGGGLAGMQASLLLAATGVQVYLVDRAPAIGGHQPLLDRTFPTDSCGLCFMSPRPAAYCPFVECERSENVSILAPAEVAGISGSAGDFSVRIVEHPRGVDPRKCTGCGRCADVCPVRVRSEFGGGLEERGAIYRPFVQAVPDSYVVDWSACTRCGECVKACPRGAVDLDDRTVERSLGVGAVILTPGFKAMEGGLRTEYGYGVFPNVVTSIQVERMLSHGGPTGGTVRRPSDGAIPERIAFIQCAGSRDRTTGHTYCSSICCMYAAKQTTLLRQRAPGSAVTVFQMDLRSVGKGYEGYMARVQAEPGVEYRRSAVGAVKQVPGSKDLLVRFVGPDGEQREERFGLVVLSVGVRPSDGVRELADRLGVPLNGHGFIESDPLFREKTPVEGIFVAGGAREPMDVADAVAEGAAAAASAAALLGVGLGEPEGDGSVDGPHPPFGRPLPEGEGRGEGRPAGSGAQAARQEPRPPDGGAPRVGVLLCDCAGEVGSRMDLGALAGSVASWRGVAGVEVVDGLCRPDAAETIGAALARTGANRLVVAACARRRLEGPIESAALAAGLDPSLMEMANLREQCAWVHDGEPEAARAQAEAQLEMAVARSLHAEPAEARRAALAPTALVVGGGAAGIAAATELASHGVEVWLVERGAELGGEGWEDGGPAARKLVSDLEGRTGEWAAVHVVTGAEVVRTEGRIGAFRSTIRKDGEEERIDHSVVVVATGVAEARPEAHLLGRHAAVMTCGEMSRRLASDPDWARSLGSAALVLCAGNRGGAEGLCSRTCCGEAIESAMSIKRCNPSAAVYVLHREMRTYGFQEERYEAARRAGVVFLRYEADRAPAVSEDGWKLRVRVGEPRLGVETEVTVDAVGLATGVAPRPVDGLASSLGIGVDRHGFLVETNVKTRSTETGRPGVFLAGACQAPRSLEDAVVHAKGAAMRALALLRAGQVVAPPTVPVVNERICSGCGLCVEACHFGARVMDDEKHVSRLVDVMCQGCGNCASACPNGATQQAGFTKKQIVAMLDAAID